jgi:lysozyme family protein
MAEFKTAVERLLKIEGGLLRDDDGVTNFGICSKYHPDVDVEKLKPKEAEEIYYKRYWLPMNLYALSNQDVVDQIFDMGAHRGPEGAVKLAQRAYNILYPAHPLKVDGDLGPKTAFALNEMKYPHAWCNAYTFVRIDYYLKRLEKYPQKEPNRVGWLNRI